MDDRARLPESLVCRGALNRFGGKPLRRIFVDPEIQKSDSTAILNKAEADPRRRIGITRCRERDSPAAAFG